MFSINLIKSRAIPPMKLHKIAEEGNFRKFKKTYFKAISDPFFNPLKKDDNGKTIMHYACLHTKRDCQLLRFLIKRKPSLINQQDKWGRTPLHIAIEAGNIPAIKHLMNVKAREDLRDIRGKTPPESYLECHHLKPAFPFLKPRLSHLIT